MSKRYREPSESQANAEALVRRERTYTAASDASLRVRWDYRMRRPNGIREAVDIVRQAYADEVPLRLHDGFNAIGEGGTPRMAQRMEAYLDDDDRAGTGRPDPETGERPAMEEYKTPFRAALASYEPTRRKIIEHVAIGSMGPIEATIKEGVPPAFARLCAEDALLGFVRNLTDVKINVAKSEAEAA